MHSATGLSVEAGKNLGLLGGDITIEGGRLNAPGGGIDLGGVEGPGTIGLNAEGSFAFPTGERRGDIAFSAAAQADVRTPDRGGEIALTGRSISLTEESQLLAGPLSGQGTLGSQAGDIRLNATGQISLTDSSHIVNTVVDNAQGNAGDVEIDAPILTMADQAQLNTSTAGQGNAGNVIIAASDRVTFNNSHAHSGLTSTAVGEGGNIEIDTPILEVLNQSSLISDTHGQGNAGDVIITASELVTFDNNSIAFSGVDWDGHGDGGDIEISTPILNIFNGGYLDTGIYEPANGGDVIITAGERVTLNRGAIYSNINWEGDGSVGNIEITTPILEILNGSKLQTIVLGQGNAGNVIIAASDRVTFNNSQAYTGLTPSGVGEGGNIEIDTPILEVLNGSTLFSITHGQGNTGDVIITASELVTFDGSFAFSGVDRNGDGGGIKISAPILNILNGGYLDTGITDKRTAGM